MSTEADIRLTLLIECEWGNTTLNAGSPSLPFKFLMLDSAAMS
jgi:hypothetical protein